jgi:membrane-bound metal-dependent hydrolase YbcI (DUF457 family)
VLGRDHALSGALAFAALAPGLHVSGAYLATGIALSAGAGVLPDIDHPDSSIALTFGFLTNTFSWLIEKVSGGHRHLTHAIPGVAVFTAGALTAGRYQLSASAAHHPAFSWHLVPAGIFLALLYSAALRALKIGGHHGDLIGIAGAAATIYTGADLITLTSWHVPLIGLATAIGCVAHIAGDELTHGGCPLLYPVSDHEFHLLPRPLRITTAKITESYVIFPVLTGALALVIWSDIVHRG